MTIMLKTQLRTFALDPKTYRWSLLHLSLLSAFLFVVFYNEHQRFFQGTSSRSSKLFSTERMLIGKSLPEKLFSCLIGMEVLLLLFFTLLLFGNYFRDRARQGRLEWLCASPYSYKKILQWSRRECVLSLIYFLLPTVPLYAICFILGLSWNRWVLWGFLFIFCSAFCSLHASLYLALQQKKSFIFYRNLLVFSVLWWFCSLCLTLFYPFLPFYLLASLGPFLGGCYFLKAQSAERIFLWLQ